MIEGVLGDASGMAVDFEELGICFDAEVREYVVADVGQELIV